MRQLVSSLFILVKCLRRKFSARKNYFAASQLTQITTVSRNRENCLDLHQTPWHYHQMGYTSWPHFGLVYLYVWNFIKILKVIILKTSRPFESWPMNHCFGKRMEVNVLSGIIIGGNGAWVFSLYLFLVFSVCYYLSRYCMVLQGKKLFVIFLCFIQKLIYYHTPDQRETPSCVK